MELSPFRVTLWPEPLWERIQSPPDCFRHPRMVDSEPFAPEVLVVLWLLPGVVWVLPGVVCVLPGVVCCC